MDDRNGFVITNHDRVLRAWQNSTELVRDYQEYAHEMAHADDSLSRLFAGYAEDEALHAAQLLELLQDHKQ